MAGNCGSLPTQLSWARLQQHPGAELGLGWAGWEMGAQGTQGTQQGQAPGVALSPAVPEGPAVPRDSPGITEKQL